MNTSSEKNTQPKGFGSIIAFFNILHEGSNLLKTVLFSCAVEIVFLILGVPIYIQLIFGAIAALALGLAIRGVGAVSFSKRKGVDTSLNLDFQAQPPIIKMPLDLDEVLIASFPGILPSNQHYQAISAHKGYAAIQTGTNPHPENSVLITNRHFVFIYAPLPYGDQMIMGKIISADNWIWSSASIAASLEKLLKMKSLQEIYDSYKGNFSIPFEGNAAIILFNKSATLYIQLKDGKEFYYQFASIEKFRLLKETLNSLHVSFQISDEK